MTTRFFFNKLLVVFVVQQTESWPKLKSQRQSIKEVRSIDDNLRATSNLRKKRIRNINVTVWDCFVEIKTFFVTFQ